MTVDMIFEAIARKYNILLIKGSGGVADLIAETLAQHKEEEDEEEDFDDPEDVRVYSDYGINAVVGMCKKNKHLFTTIGCEDNMDVLNNFIFDRILCTKDVGGSVHDTPDPLKLALVLRDPQLLRKVISTQTAESKFRCVGLNERTAYKSLERLFVTALALGDVEFVGLLLTEYQIDISQLLTGLFSLQ